MWLSKMVTSHHFQFCAKKLKNELCKNDCQRFSMTACFVVISDADLFFNAIFVAVNLLCSRVITHNAIALADQFVVR